MNEHFYICDSCGRMRTLRELLKECSNGGNGDCGCMYFSFEIKKMDGNWILDCQTDRIIKPYSEIPEEIYNILKDVTNDVERVKIFNDWWRNYVYARN